MVVSSHGVGTIIDAWEARVVAHPDSVAIRYFDGSLTARELDTAANALGAALQARSVAPGDRIGIYLQNTPYYPITLLALWKVGAIAVPLNPMYRKGELRRLVDDAGVTGIVATSSDDELVGTLGDSTVRWVVTASDRDFQRRHDERVLSVRTSTPAAEDSVLDLMDSFAGRVPDRSAAHPDDVALICYTSGTTGAPKGALNSHRNFLRAARNFARWVAIAPNDVVLAIAPLFHITGLTLNLGITLVTDTSLVMTARFHPEVVISAIAEHGVTFTIGSITAFNALLNVESATRADFRSVKALYSGGAPIPPSTIARFRDRFGPYLHNVWGMTETTGGGIAVPLGVEAPIHQSSGTLSIGVPMEDATVRVLDLHGQEVLPGQPGELEFESPQVISGYWRKPTESAVTLPQGRLRTGDVAIRDQDGWVYLVDRLKDVIIASGFKVWPREVEDVLYSHPAVFEVAVVGEPDEYRGETVAAYVSVAPGSDVRPADLIAYARDRLAAYKYPRKVYVVENLPKTATGKIRRNSVRSCSLVLEGAELEREGDES